MAEKWSIPTPGSSKVMTETYQRACISRVIARRLELGVRQPLAIMDHVDSGGATVCDTSEVNHMEYLEKKLSGGMETGSGCACQAAKRKLLVKSLVELATNCLWHIGHLFRSQFQDLYSLYSELSPVNSTLIYISNSLYHAFCSTLQDGGAIIAISSCICMLQAESGRF